MDKDTDLLPWILGGLMIATGALALAVRSTDRTATVAIPANVQVPVPSSARTLSVTAAAPIPLPMVSPNTPPASGASSVSTAQVQSIDRKSVV